MSEVVPLLQLPVPARGLLPRLPMQLYRPSWQPSALLRASLAEILRPSLGETRPSSLSCSSSTLPSNDTRAATILEEDDEFVPLPQPLPRLVPLPTTTTFVPSSVPVIPISVPPPTPPLIVAPTESTTTPPTETTETKTKTRTFSFLPKHFSTVSLPSVTCEYNSVMKEKNRQSRVARQARVESGNKNNDSKNNNSKNKRQAETTEEVQGNVTPIKRTKLAALEMAQETKETECKVGQLVYVTVETSPENAPIKTYDRFARAIFRRGLFEGTVRVQWLYPLTELKINNLDDFEDLPRFALHAQHFQELEPETVRCMSSKDAQLMTEEPRLVFDETKNTLRSAKTRERF